MADIAPRNPVLGLLRLLALAWTLLSLLGVGLGMLAVLYAFAWGCLDSASGYATCAAPTIMLPVVALSSLFVSAVVLLFAHLFYMAGARERRVEFKRPKMRDLVTD